MLSTLFKNSNPVKSSFDEIFNSIFDNESWLNINFNQHPGYEQAICAFDNEKKEHIITIQAPGFKKENIEISVDNEGISLKGEIKDESIKKLVAQNKFHYVMKKTGINENNIEAKLEDGILTVIFKTDKEKSTKTINIK